MAVEQLAVASAVILPDTVDNPVSPSVSTKRRQSSFSESDAKKPRLNQKLNHKEQPIASQSSAGHDPLADRRRSGQMEERKRGQRLFGALLGTLSQSSSSAAQKRRTDIEKKQQAKLKLQAEEYDEEKKQRFEALMEVRRREQKKYKTQSMQIRHSNLLARAQFLQTQAQPVLCYKPRKLLPGDETRIKSQIEEAEKIAESETARLEDEDPEVEPPPPEAQENRPQEKDDTAGIPETVGLANDLPEPSSTSAHIDTNPEPLPTSVQTQEPVEAHDTSKDPGDDGGEIVLEGEEDTVIY